eukprot:CAMPEP_0174868400 /NCGR_PEP_ID=MMETSP1114-20130205/65913_1 /TAXON_ID=312471 /ORGANISM="Neobodo designis, Strain CCAP 1951/1" /LENGTH=505 /DNA_ID=CAMNT_0016103617 /DNA_START=50 /DNA_END=1567 /DNA_ORIENTATION=-
MPPFHAFRVTAPGRANIIGEHVDYMGGLVLPCAIEYKTTVHVACRGDGTDGNADHWSIAPDTDSSSASKPNEPEAAVPIVLPRNMSELRKVTSVDAAKAAVGWRRYVLGAIGLTLAAVMDHEHIPPIPDDTNIARGVAVAFSGTVPIGAGLSSSASLCVAFVTVTAELLARSIANEKVSKAIATALRSVTWVAKIAQQVEHQCVGVKCGIMDQFSSAAGGCILLDCSTLEFQRVPLSQCLRALGVQVVLVNSMVRHELTDGGYNALRTALENAEAQLKTALEGKRLAPHFIAETQAVLEEEFAKAADFDHAAQMGALGVLPTALWQRFCSRHPAELEALAKSSNDGIERAKYVATEGARTVLVASVIKRAADIGSVDPTSYSDSDKDRALLKENKAIHSGFSAALGAWLNETHRGLSDVLRVSTPELDTLQELIAHSPNGVGARMTGGGFGGCVVALVRAQTPEEAEQVVKAAVVEPFEAKHGVRPDVWAAAIDDAGSMIQAVSE